MMLRFRTAWVALGIGSFVVACGGSVVESGPNGDEGGAGGAVAGSGGWGGSSKGGSPPGGSGPGGSAGMIGPGGSPAGGAAGAPIDAGPDAMPGCNKTTDKFSLNVSTYDGKKFGCAAGVTNGVFELSGEIIAIGSGGSGFVLESCPPNADCMPMQSKFGVDAPGLVLNLVEGAFVNVRVQVQHPWGCTQQIEVTSLAEWGGVPNPYGKQKLIYLSAADGLAEAIPGSDIAIHKQPLGCINNEPGCGGDPPDMYTLYFGAIWQSSMGMPVPMGTAAYWPFKGPQGEQYLAVRNLRSFSSGYCDDYWNWAWYVTQAASDL